MIVENTRIALIGLRSNKLRSVLTMLGITIGVAAVIVLVSLGQAVETCVRNQFLGLARTMRPPVNTDGSQATILWRRPIFAGGASP